MTTELVPVEISPEEAYRIERRNYIGGSDSAAILGVSKWLTPLDLYLEKTGQAESKPWEDAAKQKIYKRGKLLEPIVIDMLIEERAIEVTKRSTNVSERNYYYDPEHHFLRAEIDFEFRVTEKLLEMCPEDFIPRSLLGTIQNGEIKTVHPFVAHAWGEEFSEDVPIEYAAQSMHGLMITNRDICVYGVLFGADNLTMYIVRRDEETVRSMRVKDLKFWHENVIPRIPPEPVNMIDMMNLFRKYNGKPVELDDEAAELFFKCINLKAELSVKEKDVKQLEFAVCNIIRQNWGMTPDQDIDMDNAIIMHGAVQIGTWNKQRGANLDANRLKEEMPDIYKQFFRDYWFRVLRHTKPKQTKQLKN